MAIYQRSGGDGIGSVETKCSPLYSNFNNTAKKPKKMEYNSDRKNDPLPERLVYTWNAFCILIQP